MSESQRMLHVSQVPWAGRAGPERQQKLQAFQLSCFEGPVSVCRQSAHASRLGLAGWSASASQLVGQAFRSRCVERLVPGLQQLLELCQMGCVAVSIESRQAFRVRPAELSVAE